MIEFLTLALTVTAYLGAASLQLRYGAAHKSALSPRALPFGALAMLGHTNLTYSVLTSHTLSPMGFNEAVSLAFLITNFAAVALLIWRPVQTLLVGLFPLSAVSILLATLAPSDPFEQRLAPTVVIHIASSLAANAMLALAAMQAVIVAVQDKNLRTHHNKGVTRWLPPLQKMERLLFELLWIGFALLSLAILSGFFFLEDMLAQHVAHKPVFTLCAWLVYSVLLWGHYKLGWRSRTAVKLTLSGFALILLAYFGSKFVLQLIAG
jgi:ABC-type uncharacterized transport system permease subunit